MDKEKTELLRTFLIDALPEPLTPVSRHIQIFDNYIPNTNIRLRSIRVPETKEWEYCLQKLTYGSDAPYSRRVQEIELDNAEYAQFQIFEGEEIRKNRYFSKGEGPAFTYDVYLGDLWGLNVATARFDNSAVPEELVVPRYAVFETSGVPEFRGVRLVSSTIDDVREAVAQLGPLNAAHAK
jgi:CYTH domain-containing protein